MFRLPSLLFAAVLMTSATAFAADTPDPSSKGEAALPSGSNTSAPPSDAPANKPDVATSKSENPDAPPATSPGEENKGKPPVAPQ
jgi:hypothetical protein